MSNPSEAFIGGQAVEFSNARGRKRLGRVIGIVTAADLGDPEDTHLIGRVHIEYSADGERYTVKIPAERVWLVRFAAGQSVTFRDMLGNTGRGTVLGYEADCVKIRHHKNGLGLTVLIWPLNVTPAE